jgi:type 1 glutamine amidotransferase
MEKVTTLLLTGRNNHDWARSAPFCRDLLERSGRFAVTLTEAPADVLADADAVRRYQLFFFDWNDKAEAVGERARGDFEAAVRDGAGVCILHAANNGFGGWTEYEKMCALMWREGTGHGEYHEFPVTIVDRDHPVTRGIDDFRTWDELYHRLVHMHGAAYHVLATAYSDPARGGTGDDEPVMLVTSYGRGRIFHQVLGHVWRPNPDAPDYKGATLMSFENAGFQRTLLRGCQWAATGKVTLP